MIDRISEQTALTHATIMEVDMDALLGNLSYFRKRLNPTTKLVVMIKAFGYGCGSFEIAQLLQDEGVDYLAVAFVDEGVALREMGITMPIIVLNASACSYAQMIEHNLEPEIFSLCSFEQFAGVLADKNQREYPIHLKLDTGMHRLGFEQQDIAPLMEVLHKNKEQIKVASIFTHLSSADMPNEEQFTLSQIDSYWQMANQIVDGLGYRPLCHISNSAGIVNYPQAEADMCRLGIGLYGFGDETGALTPVATLKSQILQIKDVKAGESVGYARAAILTSDSRLAVVSVGYADGLNRLLSGGRWSLLVGGEFAPIVGRISMDNVVVDITDIQGVEVGDWVTVFSAKKGNTPLDMARVLNTIPYEVMTSISSRVKRVYIKK